MSRGTHSTVDILGETVGPYRVLGALGDGRLGRLIVALQTENRGLPRVAALRHVRPQLAANAPFRSRIQRAARVAARSAHPHLISVFELAGFEPKNAEARYYVGMEYLPGENVDAILHRCGAGMPADIAAYIVKQVAGALQCLREFRDSSPQSVDAREELAGGGLESLAVADGERANPELESFGVAERAASGGDVPHDEVDPCNVFVSYHGTVKWLPLALRAIAEGPSELDGDASRSVAASSRAESDPVVAEGDAGVDAQRRADVAGLGRLLWTCLAGETPVASAVPLDAPRAPSGLNPGLADVPDALGTIVKRALSQSPHERFAGPGEMADELDRYLFRRPSRPTPRHLRRWLEQLFGSERALLQTRVVRGRDVQAALSHLGAALPAAAGAKSVRSFSSPRPRELWATRQSTFSQFGRPSIAPTGSFDRTTPSRPDVLARLSRVSMPHSPFGVEPPPSTLPTAELPARSPPADRPSRAGWAIVTLAACAVLAGAALMLVPPRPGSSPFGAPSRSAAAPDASGGVSVRSTPDGGAVFIDGEPTGLLTPVVIRGLAAGRSVRIRVEKAGFQSRELPIEIVAGSIEERTFELGAATGRVRLIGAPGDARVYVDDAAVVLIGDVVAGLSVGAHAVRVETRSALLFSGTVDVVPGEQTIQLARQPGR